MDPLLEAVLRKDPEKTRRSQEVEAFLSRLGAERKAKLAETTGVLDLLTLHPALKTGQALRAKSFIPAGANALAFASQFGDDMLSRALGDASVALPLVAGARGLSSSARAVRGLEELAANAGMTSVGNFAARRMGMDVGGSGTDEKAAIPVFEGVTTTGKLRQMAKRAAEKGKDLPQFSWEGKIAPARQRKLEKDMRAWIPMLGSKDPEGQVKLLDEWVKNNPFWGKYPLEKGPMLDLMPAKLRPAMNFALMNSGYGGINMGERTALGSRGEKLGTRARNEKFSEIQPFSERKFEEIMPYYMSGNLPAGWAAANPGRQPSWIARPGEELAPGQRNFLDAFAKSAGSGGAAGALGAGIAGGMMGIGDTSPESSNNIAGIVVNPKNATIIAKRQRQLSKELQAVGMPKNAADSLAYFRVKYPKLAEQSQGNLRMYKVPGAKSTAGTYQSDTGMINLNYGPSGYSRFSPPSDIISALAHENLHAADFNRLQSGLLGGAPIRRRLDLGDFANTKEGVLAARDRKLRESGLDLGLPEPKYKPLTILEKLDASLDEKGFNDVARRYAENPIEDRAMRGEATARNTYEKFRDLTYGNRAKKQAMGAGAAAAAGTALDSWALGSFGTDESTEDDQAAVPGWKKALRAPYRKQMDEALSRRKRIELIPEKLYPLMEPDFNKVPVTDPWIESLFKHRGGYYAHPKRGNYELLFEGWPKAGLSIQRPEKFSWLGEDDAKKLKIDAYHRQNIPSIMKYVKASEDRQKILEEFNKKHKVYRDSILNYPGFYGPQYEIPRMPETPWPDLETRFESNPRDLSAVSRILGAQFPEYENIGGYRVSGIRKGKAGKYKDTAGAETSVRLRKSKSEEDRLKTLVDSRRWLHELISAKGNTPAVMAVGGSAAPNPLGPVKNIFDFLGKPEDYFNLR